MRRDGDALGEQVAKKTEKAEKKVDGPARDTDRPRDKKSGQYLPVRPKVTVPEATTRNERALRPRECRGYLRRELARSFRSIVGGFVKQAESGSVQHLKLANELLGEGRVTKPKKGSAVLWAEMLGAAGSGEAGETP